MSLYCHKQFINDVDQALRMYGRKEFRSPLRSTVPLLSWLKHEQPMVSSLLASLGMPADSDLYLEYTVSPPAGKGKASQSDVMAVSGPSALAMEAKWTEPRYPAVSEWLAAGSNLSNRQSVLAGWLGCLEDRVGHALHLPDFFHSVYQMVHRAASACAAGSQPRLAYLVFKPSPAPRSADVETIRSDLTSLWNALGSPSEFPFYLVELPLWPTAAFEAIAQLPKGHEATGEKVTSALSESARLFGFAEYHVTRIVDRR